MALITACSNRSVPPPVFASGYIADRGVVRLWRKDDAGTGLTTLLTVYSPLWGADTQVTRYQYQQGHVRDIQWTRSGPRREETRLRFAEDGAVSFMQRQRAAQRGPVSEEEIALSRFDARRMLELSAALRAGNVRLLQGRWRDGRATTCDGRQLRPDLDETSRTWIARREQHSVGPLSIAWLEAPEGTQLLLVANGDFCRWEPTEDKL